MADANADFFEIDFLKVETKQSGDAIALRYRVNGITSIHVVDGGFEETGSHVVEYIQNTMEFRRLSTALSQHIQTGTTLSDSELC